MSFVLAVIGLVVPLAFAGGARQAHLEWRDGSTTVGRVAGIGCIQSMCSRLATVTAIREICDGSALFVYRDGTERRVPLDRDNRILYLTASSGAVQKIDLQRLQSLELDTRVAR